MSGYFNYRNQRSYSKYRNEKVYLDGIKFDSNRECQRYIELKTMLNAGLIKDLELQKTFVLQEGYSINGHKVRPITYKADFVYFDVKSHKIVVEDVKGMRTDVYKIKKKLFEYKFRMPIVEI